jgi:hypothetical protein
LIVKSVTVFVDQKIILQKFLQQVEILETGNTRLDSISKSKIGLPPFLTLKKIAEKLRGIRNRKVGNPMHLLI